jgi:hypothetical protein
MKRRSVLFAAACAVMTLASSAAQAGTVVFSDSGSLGGFTMTNEGISGTTATILISKLPNAQSFINNVNGVVVPQEPVSVNGPVTLLVTPTGGEEYSLALSPPEYTKSVGGTAGSQAQLMFNQTLGVAPTKLPSFFNSSGTVTSLVSNNNPTYDFSPFADGLGSINLTFTATTFTGGVHSFADLFSTKGATATGSGAFSQLAVVIPEPASVALLGIGMSGLFALRRFFKRPSAGRLKRY